MPIPALVRRALAVAAVAALTAGCSIQTAPVAPVATPEPAAPAASTPTAEPVSQTQPVESDASGSPAVPAGVATVPGYAPGQFPPVPLFSLPDTSVLNSAGTALRDKLVPTIKEIPGATVKAVSCGADGSYVDSASGLVLYGDGSGSYTGPDGSLVRDAKGGETVSTAGESITRDGRGGGTYSNAELSIVNSGDGSGVYSSATVTVTLDGKGGGTFSDAGESITNDGDGSGTYSSASVSIVVDKNGSGTYSDATLSITNDGKGEATVSSAAGSWIIKADPIPPVPPLGKFPPVESMRPRANSCGFVITLADGVLFDFDKFDLRADASATLDKLADMLQDVQAKQIRVSGHTDAIGTDAYNQTLSEKRAAAVVGGLTQRGVASPMTSAGFGESRPVAPNELKGRDNPAGRQLNRRVEIFVKA